MIDNYTYPQETWDAKECAKRAKYNPKNAYGDRNPWAGLIADSGSAYPGYGRTVNYNGGTFIDGKHYRSVTMPLPKIHDDYEFVKRPSWGLYIQRKPNTSPATTQTGATNE